MFCSAPSLKPFHRLFLSCNDPQPNKQWCTRCEKCVFVFLILSAFLPPQDISEIFSVEMFSSMSRESVFLNVLGFSSDGSKPFECIGTAEESRTALEMSVWQYLQQMEANKLPELLLKLCDRCEISVEEISRNREEKSVKEILERWMKKDDR